MSRTITSLSGSVAFLARLAISSRRAFGRLPICGLPRWRIGRGARHDHLDRAGLVVIAVPLRAQLHDGVVERHADAPAHADDHRLAVERRHAGLEMLHEVFGNHCEALLRTDQRLDARPFALEPLLLARRLVLGELGDLGVDLRLLVLIEFDARQSALVVDRHGRAVLDRAADVVDVDVVAEHRRRVHIVLLDRRAGEADEGGVRQAVAQVFGEAVGDLAGLALDLGSEAVLAAMRLVGDHDDVASVGQHRIVGRAVLGREFLQGGEDHATRRPVEQLAQMLAVLGLLRRLAQQVLAHAERAEQLVVQIVAVGQHDQRRVLHRRMLDDLARIERHQQALAGPLGVPDHARPSGRPRPLSPPACSPPPSARRGTGGSRRGFWQRRCRCRRRR